MSLSILSLNCNGLRNQEKREEVFDYLDHMDYDIYCLQETHFMGIEETVKKEWNGTWFFDSLTNRSGGVAILFRKAAAIIVEKKTVDVGRCLMIEFFTGKKRCLLCCIYGYNEDKPLEEFFKQVEKKVDEFCCENVILCGDFNQVLNPELDYKHHTKSKRNSEARKALSKLMENQKLVDIFRKMNPGVPAFTYQRAYPPSSARLDFFLISENLRSNFLPGIHCIESGIITSGVVDHSIITLSLIKIGEGLWEFDNSLLLNKEFVESIKYVVLLNKFDVPTFYYQGYFENLLQKIKSKCILYSANKNHSKTLHEQKRGVEEGELRSILSGIIPCIKLENDFIYEQSVILEKTKEYYEELYSNECNSAEDEDRYFSFLKEKKVFDVDKSSLDAYGPITWREAKETLDRMKSNNSPGSDGFTLEFFNVFGKILVILLFNQLILDMTLKC